MMLPRSSRVLTVCFAYVFLHLLAHISARTFEVGPGISIWYAPCGLALSLLVLLGNAYVPLVFAVNVFTAIVVSGFLTPWAPIVFPLLVTANAALAAGLVQRYLGGILLPGSARRTAWFAGIMLLSPALAALTGSAILLALGYHTWTSFWHAVLQWWVGDLSGLITVVPAVMVFVRPWLRNEPSPYLPPVPGQHPVLGAVLLALLLCTTLALVFVFEPLQQLNAFHLCFLPLVWIALRYGLPGATLATLAVTIGGLAGMHFRGDPANIVGNFFLFEMAVAGVGLGLGHVVMLRHQTENDRLERERRMLQMQQYESLGILAGGIAHEFNNLLTSIVGNASLARIDLPEGSPLHQPLTQIEASSWRAAELCRQMLAYAGRTPPVFEPLDLAAFLDKNRQLLSLSFGRNVALEFHLDARGSHIDGDSAQLRQLITQLIVNAAESIGDQAGRIEVRTQLITTAATVDPVAFQLPPAAATPHLQLDVSDTGPGMPPEIMRRIFDPFFSTKPSGHGLGLPAVLGIVKAHRGGLAVESQPGKGTRFRLFFPLSRHKAASANAPSEKTPLGIRRAGGTVLVVDDETNVREVVSRIVQNLGYHPISAANGPEALELFAQHSRQLAFVLLDLRMPQMDGEEVFQNMHRQDPLVPVILMSGFSEKFSLEHFPAGRTTGFITKPFDARALRAYLDQTGLAR